MSSFDINVNDTDKDVLIEKLKSKLDKASTIYYVTFDHLTHEQDKSNEYLKLCEKLRVALKHCENDKYELEQEMKRLLNSKKCIEKRYFSTNEKNKNTISQLNKHVESYELCSKKMTEVINEHEKVIIRQNNKIQDLESTVRLNKNVIEILKHSEETANEITTKELSVTTEKLQKYFSLAKYCDSFCSYVQPKLDAVIRQLEKEPLPSHILPILPKFLSQLKPYILEMGTVVNDFSENRFSMNLDVQKTDDDLTDISIPSLELFDKSTSTNIDYRSAESQTKLLTYKVGIQTTITSVVDSGTQTKLAVNDVGVQTELTVTNVEIQREELSGVQIGVQTNALAVTDTAVETDLKAYETTGVQADFKVHEFIDIGAENFPTVQIDLSAGDAQIDSLAHGATSNQTNNYSHFETATNKIHFLAFETAAVHIETCDTVKNTAASSNLAADLTKRSETPETTCEISDISEPREKEVFDDSLPKTYEKDTQTAISLLHYDEIELDAKDSPIVSKNKNKIDKYNRKLIRSLTSTLSSLDEGNEISRKVCGETINVAKDLYREIKRLLDSSEVKINNVSDQSLQVNMKGDVYLQNEVTRVNNKKYAGFVEQKKDDNEEDVANLLEKFGYNVDEKCCHLNYRNVLKKIDLGGFQSLSFQELSFMHRKIIENSVKHYKKYKSLIDTAIKKKSLWQRSTIRENHDVVHIFAILDKVLAKKEQEIAQYKSTIAEQSGVLKKLLSAEIEKQKKVERKLTNAAKKHCERPRNETKTRLSHSRCFKENETNTRVEVRK